MAEILPFVRPEKPEEHLTGPALCVGCRTEWVAVAPVGTWQLECPTCGSMKGIFRRLVGAGEKDLVFTCSCGCEALTAYMQEGKFWLRCMSCGEDKTEAVFG